LFFKPEIGKKVISPVGDRRGNKNAPDSRVNAFDVSAELTDSVRSDSPPFQFQNNWGPLGVVAPDINRASGCLILTFVWPEPRFNAVWLGENKIPEVIL
jgi:hypothetical protein